MALISSNPIVVQSNKAIYWKCKIICMPMRWCALLSLKKPGNHPHLTGDTAFPVERGRCRPGCAQSGGGAGEGPGRTNPGKNCASLKQTTFLVFQDEKGLDDLLKDLELGPLLHPLKPADTRRMVTLREKDLERVKLLLEERGVEFTPVSWPQG